MSPPKAPPAAEPSAMDSFLHALPKVELHCHLLGSVRRKTFETLVRRQNAPLSSREIEDFYTRGDKPVGVLRVLRALDAWLLKTPDDFHRLAYEYLEDAAAHHVRYAEFFWNPTGTARDSGMGYPQVLAALLRAIADAERDFHIIGRVVPSIDREADAAAAVQMVQWVLQHRADEVPGIGIDYREELGPPERFVEAYAAARAGGLRCTAHAGEFGLPSVNVRTAIEQLKVDRIDHGYTIVDDPVLTQQALDAELVFTVVPTNSYYLRTLSPSRWAQDHPIRKMRALGLRVHPNTDDPTLHHIDPTGAWRMMQRSFGYGVDDLHGCMLNGLDAAWIDEATRQRWRSEFSAEFDVLRKQWQPK